MYELPSITKLFSDTLNEKNWLFDVNWKTYHKKFELGFSSQLNNNFCIMDIIIRAVFSWVAIALGLHSYALWLAKKYRVTLSTNLILELKCSINVL